MPGIYGIGSIPGFLIPGPPPPLAAQGISILNSFSWKPYISMNTGIVATKIGYFLVLQDHLFDFTISFKISFLH